MILPLLAASALLPVDSPAQNPAPAPGRWFVLLVRGDGPRPKEQAALQEMQNAHIGNLVKRHGEGKLVAAGPLNDVTKHRRGIAVLTVATRAEVKACFVGDPFIDNRIMHVEAHKWITPVHGFGAVPDPEKIAPHRMVRLTFPSGYKGAFPKIPGGIGGRFAGERFGVLLTANTDDAAIESSLRASAAVRSGTAYEIVQLWMSAGTLKPGA